MIGLILTVLCAYPLSRRDLPGRSVLTFFVFFTMLFNGGLVPTYLVYTQIFHIKNHLAALIVPNLLVQAYNVMLAKTFFQTSIKKMIDLEKLLEKWNNMPRIEETGPKHGVNAPVMSTIRRRLRVLYGSMCVIGTIPAILLALGLVEIK